MNKIDFLRKDLEIAGVHKITLGIGRCNYLHREFHIKDEASACGCGEDVGIAAYERFDF